MFLKKLILILKTEELARDHIGLKVCGRRYCIVPENDQAQKTAIALKDEVASVWLEVNKTLDVIRDTVDEESVAKEAVQKATMALALAEARLQVVVESLGAGGGPEASEETEKRDDSKKEELQKEVDKLNKFAGTIQISALKAEEDVATQRVNDGDIALQRAENATLGQLVGKKKRKGSHSRQRREQRRRREDTPPMVPDLDFPENKQEIDLNDPRGLSMEETSVLLNSDQAETCLGNCRDRIREVTSTITGDGDFRLSDSDDGTLFLHWTPRKPGLEFLSNEETIKVIEIATGFIRDQHIHPLCWAFVLNDMISSSLVLHGLEDEYVPLSQVFLAENISKDKFGELISEDSDLEDSSTHSCYDEVMYSALRAAKDLEGVPQATKKELTREYNCNTRGPVSSTEKKYGGITGVFRYDTLEDALERLKTHPVAASLSCFGDWEEEDIITGEGRFKGVHEVLMLDCRLYKGTVVVRCKSSTGRDTGHDGYLYVSLEVMFTRVGGTRMVAFSCPKKPEYLLSEFFSIDMRMGANPQFQQTEEQRKKNLKFKINFEKEAKDLKDGSRSAMCTSGSSRYLGQTSGMDGAEFATKDHVIHDCFGEESCIKVPYLGAVSYLTLAVLLSCAFMYDILWGFVSKWWFRERVIIVVNEEEASLLDFLWLLLASVIFVPLFQKIPRVTGFAIMLLRDFCAVLMASSAAMYLAAGILIGPYGLSIIRNVHATKAITEFGVVFLLFNISLEIGFQAIAEALGLAGVKAVVAITAIVFGGRLLDRSIYKQVAENRNANTLLVTSLLTAMAGLSMALGAFLAGLLLAETEFSLRVESDIAPYRGLLMGLFFMTVGMSIDPKLLLSKFPVVMGTLGLLLVGKTILVVSMGKLFGISIRAGLLLAPGGEFAFVAFGEAVNQGIMSPKLSSLLFLVVGISMAITPWLAGGGQFIASRLELHDVRSLLPVESEDHIIICGFGRIGQIIAQLLSERLIPFVALDVSSERVTIARSLDLPVYFGDAGSREVLHKIGADRACAAVVALDAPGANYRCVWALSKYYPNVKTFVRAHDVVHGLNLEKAGATAVVPETLEPSLQLAAAVLAQVKLPTSEIANTINEFRTRHLSELTELCEANGSSLGYGFSRTTSKPKQSDSSDDNQIIEGGTLAI
ncbi:unnamed protein product [Arabis nemorensis]|uniref:RCK N-terminal domain-containing protein n=1 Tax=Arabis nemorensis TaxID=586526 RepID=A0A565AJU0_9BRAS|nr:unnamed protein product [Arabis nemorensis]